MDKFEECVTVHFKDDNGEFTEKHSLMSITRFSTVTASKIVRFEFIPFERLKVVLDERDLLVGDIYDYGKRNPASAPQCVTDLVQHMGEPL